MLKNIQSVYQLTAEEKQVLIKDLSNQFGSLQFLYAKHVWQGVRSIEQVPETYQKTVQDIHDYVVKEKYQQLFE